ncbi:MAG: ComF family protein [Hyphomicrobiales bacterium]
MLGPNAAGISNSIALRLCFVFVAMNFTDQFFLILENLRSLTIKFGQKTGRVALDIAIPPSCISCDEAVMEPGTLCPSCWQKLRFITEPRCEILGTPFAFDLGPGIISAQALASPPPFEKARAAVLYDEIARSLVARLKYEDRPDLATVMARWMVLAATDLLEANPVVVPVPLHRWRQLNRRYNQSALLSRFICQNLQLEHQPLALERVRKTAQQVGLTRRERAENVRGAFRATSNGMMRMTGRPVLLIDDVLTTGATMEAASRACLRAGAESVRVLTFALVADPLGSAAEGILTDLDPIDI